MIITFTDFGLEGPYLGQVKAVLAVESPGVVVIDLFADAPAYRPQESAYLLASYVGAFPKGAVFLCVVDPGVGTERPAVAVEIDGWWFVGPGNGLFEPLARRGKVGPSYRVVPIPGRRLSASFHGRDLFAPLAGRLARGLSAAEAGLEPMALPRFEDWPDDLPAVVYVDRYGNLMTGLRASEVPEGLCLEVNGQILRRARTFGDVAVGQGFWYENANGLAEIAINQGNAAKSLSASIGTSIRLASLSGMRDDSALDK